MSLAFAERQRTINAGSYRVTVAAGLRHEFADLIARAAPAFRYAVISDSEVAPLYADSLIDGLLSHGQSSLHVFPAGETYKTRETWSRLTDALLDIGCGRDTTIVALGGGVVGDMAGFVAATFLRGVPVVQCPTSLLAMIDASIGGKTGVDTVAGKNLVGAFHSPAAVLADLDTIRTLPLAHRRAGLAEAIKHGVIADAKYLGRLTADIPALLEADPATTLAAVARSVEIKAEVVRADAREAGVRKTLNFGHTLGHAIEQASGYALLHGEAVAIGMALEARLAERAGVAERGLAEQLEFVLTRTGLPVSRPAALDPAMILAATGADKKRRGGASAYALPVRFGAMAAESDGWTVNVDDALVLEVLA